MHADGGCEAQIMELGSVRISADCLADDLAERDKGRAAVALADERVRLLVTIDGGNAPDALGVRRR